MTLIKVQDTFVLAHGNLYVENSVPSCNRINVPSGGQFFHHPTKNRAVKVDEKNRVLTILLTFTDKLKLINKHGFDSGDDMSQYLSSKIKE